MDIGRKRRKVAQKTKGLWLKGVKRQLSQPPPIPSLSNLLCLNSLIGLHVIVKCKFSRLFPLTPPPHPSVFSAKTSGSSILNC